MKFYATEVNGDRVLISRKRPVIQKIDYTETLDAFPLYGEPTAVAHLCRKGFRGALGPGLAGLALPHLIPVRIELAIRVLEPEKLMRRDWADREAIMRLCAELDLANFSPFTPLG